MNGIPHALTWNIGTTGITTSASVIGIPWGVSDAIVWLHSIDCVYSTPFGRPVVPEV